VGWESRGGGGHRYLYVTRRVGKRIIHEYLGQGDRAEAVAREVERAKASQLAARAAIVAEEVRTREATRANEELNRVCNILLEAILLSAGFHRQNYGAWRRRRGTPTD
jgi:hypothetical protein